MTKQKFLSISLCPAGLLSFFLVLSAPSLLAQAPAPAPPAARQDNVKEMIHGVEIVDPYRWLEDQNGAETRKWEAEENAYTHSLLDKLPQRPAISRRITEMLHFDTMSAPGFEGGYYFFTRKGADQDLSSLYRRKGATGADELLIDPLPMSPDHTTSVGFQDVTEDASLMLYSVRHGGEDEIELRVMDLQTHRDLPDVLPRALYFGATWKKDNKGFYYTLGRRDVGKRVYYHALGTNPTKDKMIFGEGYGPDTWLDAYPSEDGKYLLVNAQAGWAKNELFIQRQGKTGPFQPLITGRDAHFNPRFAGDFLIVQTDWQAPRNRILKIDLRDPRPEKWQEIVPMTQDSIESFSLIGGKLFVNYLHNVTSRIAIFSLEGKPLGEVALPSAGSARVSGRYDRDEGILTFSSYTTPGSIYRYSASTGKRDLWFRNPIPFDSDRYEMEQVWYSSKDGTRVPMFLVHRKGYKPDGNTPTILYGYGGFNVSLLPGFNSTAAWWIEHGGVYAVANLRGGGEFGEAWHKAGMLEHKQNVFDDFIAAAEWLIKNKYTNPSKLAIWGGSNGGLLVGSVMTQRPELFRAVICEHPDLDMVRYYKFTKNNNPPALLEYGNAADPAQFKYLYAYSPYQHVQAGTKYPAVLITSGDADTRVPPEQARKMAARLQAATSSGLPVMLLYDTKAGHSGGRPFSQVVDELSLKLSFLAWELGLNSNEKSASEQAQAPPVTRQDNVKDVIHGVEIVDPYRWLEDGDSQETKSWVAAQNAYMHSLLDGLPMRQSIDKRMKDMYNRDFVSGPFQEGGYYFFYKMSAGQDLWSIYRRKASGGPDELLLDPLPMSPDHTTAVSIRDVTSDGNLLMYVVRRGGEDETEIHVLDINRHRDLPDVMPRAIYTALNWKADNSGFYYGIRQRDNEPRIYFHALGTDPAKDAVVFANGYKPDIWLTPYTPVDGHCLFSIAWFGWSKSEIYFKDLAKDSKFVPLIAGIDANFHIRYAGDMVIVQTDWKAPNGRLLKIDLHHPEQDKWQEIVPEKEYAMQDFSVIGGRIFVNYLHNVSSRIEIFSLEGKPVGEVELPSLGSASMSGRWDRDEGFLYFSSFTTPDTVYRYSAASGKRDIWFRSPIPIEPDGFQADQVWYSSKDGTRIPMFLIHRKGLKPDEHTPVLLYGYGGFDTSLTPDFNPIAVWWAEQGGIYAVANIRGGGEFGEAWHKAGMLEHKQNVFDDFIAAAEWLIKNKYTSPQKLAIWGGSNGGLLVGTVTTQRPELFRAVICDHPDLDIVRYPKLKNHNSSFMSEYGNADDPDQFKFVYAYSPYQHVVPGAKYPAMLFTSGDEDTRVPPEQARKMTARMQAATNSGLPIILMYDAKAGHSGGRPLSQRIEEEALKLSFLVWQLDMKLYQQPTIAQETSASHE